MDLSGRSRLPPLIALLIIVCVQTSQARFFGDRLKRQNGANMYLPASSIVPGGEGDDPNEWTEWSSPSECSRSCGGGVSYQTRECRRTGPDGSPMCSGGNRRYFSCNTQDCPEDEPDFRSQQCARFNNVPFDGIFYNWVPYKSAPNPCELNCMPKGERFYYRHKAKVIDGTRCNDEDLNVCVDGQCLPVGCDMMLGSNAKEDKCRQCGGDGTTCRTLKDRFTTNNLATGYNDILLVPSGATNIRITETAPSNNYLACRNLTSHYYLNGNWRIDFPRPMFFAGSWWTYQRKPHGFAAPDQLTCRGPITESIYIVVLVQDKNVSVDYEYSIPQTVISNTPAVYNWTHMEFGPCSASCGGGVQHRNVSCNNRFNLDRVDDHFCDERTKPVESQECGTEPCAPHWQTAEWGKCSKGCGSDGVQNRTVTCERISPTGERTVEDDAVCLQEVGNKPATEQECNRDVKNCPKYHLGPWSPCDKLCGEGKKTRKVTCYIEENGRKRVLSDEDCVEEKPETETTCMLAPCEGVDWIISQWSGCDACGQTTETRTAICGSKSGKVYPDEFCAPEVPLLSRPCESKKCKTQWFTSEWSKCSSPCGKGVQSRVVLCGEFDGNTVTKVTDESKCDAATKPEASKECEGEEEECPGQWFTGPWGSCSKPCGGGERQREVMCLANGTKSDNCDETKIEALSEKCNTQACTDDEIMPVDTADKEISDDEEEDCEDEEEEDVKVVTAKMSEDLKISDGIELDEETTVSSFITDELMMSDSTPPTDTTDEAASTDAPLTTVEGSGDATESTSLSSMDTEEGSGDMETTSESGVTESQTGSTEGSVGTEDTTVDLLETTGSSSTDETTDALVTDSTDSSASTESSTDLTKETEGVSGSTQDFTEESTESPGTTDGVTEATGSTDVSSSTDATQTTDSTSSTDASEPTGATGSSTDVSGSTEASTESSTTIDVSDTTDATDSTAASVSTDASDSTDATSSTDVSDTTDAPASTDASSSTENSAATEDSTTSDTSTETSASTSSDVTETTSSDITDPTDTTPSDTTPPTDTTPSDTTPSTDTTASDATSSTDASSSTDATSDTTPSSDATTEESGSTGVSETTTAASSDATDVSGTTDVSASTDASDSTDPSTSTEGSDSTTDVSESTDSSGPTEASTATETTDSSDTTDVSGSTESFVSTDASASTDSSDSTDESSSTDESTESSGSTVTEAESTLSTDETSESSPAASTASTDVGSSSTDVGFSSTVATDITDTTTDSGISSSTEAAEDTTTDVSGQTTSSDATGLSDVTTDTASEASTSGSDTTSDESSETTTSSQDLSTSSDVFDSTPESSGDTSLSTDEATTVDIWTSEDDEFEKSTPNTLQAVITKETKPRKCKRKKPKDCSKTEHGCCPDGKSVAKGPFDEGCPIPKTCKDTEFGCCPDGVSPSAGSNNEGCPKSQCAETLFGCCPDKFTPAEGEDDEGCPEPTTEPPTTTTEMPEEETTMSTEPALENYVSTEEPESTESTEVPETTEAPATPEIIQSCSFAEFGCCPDGTTEATGPDFAGCDAPTLTSSTDCRSSEFGCCPDGRTAASGPDYQGCPACTHEPFGCCPDNETPAHGSMGEGCCLNSVYGCCPDNINSARGPNFEGCECQYAPYGCCPDNKTAALGPNNKGCDCESSQFGCCPDKLTAAQGSNFEGCACHTFQFGCCPDGITVAQGPQQQGCHCLQTPFKCCPDEKTPAKGWNFEGCTCLESKYGCCPDGVTSAQGSKFEGCENVKEPPQKACGLPKETGPCGDFSIKYFFDTSYGACAKFWYGGCEGNGNRFESESECKETCQEYTGKEACYLPKSSGPCTGDLTKWYFDAERGRCEQFKYGGCFGTNNRFDTKEECQSFCAVSETTPPCDQPMDEGPCEGNFERWFYDNQTDVCRPFRYGGCKGNKNNYPTEYACNYHCRQPGVHKEAEPAVNEVLPVNRCEQYENECAALSCPYGKHRVAVDEECSRCECDNPCADYECPDGQQCAVEVSNERSGEFKPECRLINKPGICPRLTASDGECGRECNTDADCRENNKCCSNGCGFVCVHPAVPTRPTTAPTTPAPVVVYPEDVKASLVPKEKAETDVNTPLGGIAVLRCFATGNPAPNVTWSRNNVVVDTNQGRYVLTSSGDLTIVQVRQTDSGSYVCLASNGLGEPVRREIELQVTVPVNAVIGKDPSNTYQPGSTVAFSCSVQGYPTPNVTWTKDGLPLVPSERVQISVREPYRVIINNVSTTDSGKYGCKAANAVSYSFSEENINIESTIPLNPECIDNGHFANCNLIVRGRYCKNKYYAKFCCRSCALAGQL